MTRLVPVLLAAVLPIVQEKEQEWSRYFPLAAGNEWEYSVRKSGKESLEHWKIAGVEKRKGVDCFNLQIKKPVPSGPGGKIQIENQDFHVAPTKQGVEIVEAKNKNISEEERYLLRYPLQKGTKGSIFWSAPREAEVAEKPEEVTVPAGKFTCVVLSWKTSYPGTAVHSRLWVAPDIGIVKRETVWKPEKGETDTDTMELKKFTAGKK